MAILATPHPITLTYKAALKSFWRREADCHIRQQRIACTIGLPCVERKQRRSENQGNPRSVSA
jgi:hypothetical protein